MIRGDLVESVHLGHLVVLDPSGRPVIQVGNPTTLIWPRSSLKPLQLVAMLRAGLELPDRLLALAAASHNGEQFHLEGVLQILASRGLGTGALQNTPDLPLYPPAALDWHMAPLRRRAGSGVARAELLGQARGDARHLPDAGLGHRDLPVARAPAAAGRPRDDPGADRRRRGGHAHHRRRLRRAAVLDDAARPGTCVLDPGCRADRRRHLPRGARRPCALRAPRHGGRHRPRRHARDGGGARPGREGRRRGRLRRRPARRLRHRVQGARRLRPVPAGDPRRRPARRGCGRPARRVPGRARRAGPRAGARRGTAGRGGPGGLRRRVHEGRR